MLWCQLVHTVHLNNSGQQESFKALDRTAPNTQKSVTCTCVTSLKLPCPKQPLLPLPNVMMMPLSANWEWKERGLETLSVDERRCTLTGTNSNPHPRKLIGVTAVKSDERQAKWGLSSDVICSAIITGLTSASKSTMTHRTLKSLENRMDLFFERLPVCASSCSPLTCHASGEKVSTGNRLDGDARLALEETWNELRLHLLHHTRQEGLAGAHRWSLQPFVTNGKTKQKNEWIWFSL